MKRRGFRDLLFLGLMVVLVGLLVIQGYRMLRPQTEHADAGRMLYEVSLFQMQVLNTSLLDAADSGDTNGLNALKLAAYSAAFTHDRLANALGRNNLYAFPALGGLVDAITSWQIGGNRPLREEEKELLREYGGLFSGALQSYQQLLSESGHVISSKNDELKKTGKQLAELVKGK
ncbi:MULTISPECIES: S-adenosylmethionine decarboxylase [Paenibacillus]|uniref:S-adenosylmethionine decarboxylase n=1 Tax=Paenibacillus albilobatus TaxID=2716884 RepID=A0A919XM31_9BACL|nr:MULTISPECIES: S-adenosylmethionine decarboxylase [Paenibacillus]GIO34726.1 hypothetical protein J2TS6_58670 [Paenibacillus albilobatus]